MTEGPRTVVWAGASYSWTWWADLLEALGWFDVTFPTDAECLRASLGTADLLLVGGGDLPVAADALDRARARQWLEAGGVAVGTCAGAYAMRRWAGAGVLNTVDSVPRGAPPRAWTRCAEGIVMHVVRGPIRLATSRGVALRAHLYGGPVLDADPAGGVEVLARYSGPAEGAEVLLPESLQLVDGTPAVLGCEVGKGRLLLSGPHLEHPGSDDVHAWFAQLLGFSRAVRGTAPPALDVPPHTAAALAARLRRVRCAAISAGDRRWHHGDRLWGAERVAAMADAVLRRLAALRAWGWPLETSCAMEALGGIARIPTATSADDEWSALLGATSDAGAHVMEVYFEALRVGMPAAVRHRPTRLRGHDDVVGQATTRSGWVPGVVRP